MSSNYNTDLGQRRLQAATHFVDELCQRGQSVTSTCQDWALRAYELRELGTEGSQLYHRLSQIDHNYDSRGTTANFHSACRNPNGWRGTHRTLRSFFRLCRDLLLPLPPGYSTWQQLLGELYAGEEQSGEHAAPVTFSDITVSYIPDIFLLRTQSTRSTFCRSVVAAGLLTQQQMEHAAERYRLGARVDESVIFWQIDHEGRVCEGKVMYYDDDCHRLKDADHRPRTMSSILKTQRNHDGEPELPKEWRGRRCLFGEHLVKTPQTASPPNPLSPQRGGVNTLEGKETASPPGPLSPQRGGVNTLEGEETASFEGEKKSVNSVNYFPLVSGCKAQISCKIIGSEEENLCNSLNNISNKNSQNYQNYLSQSATPSKINSANSVNSCKTSPSEKENLCNYFPMVSGCKAKISCNSLKKEDRTSYENENKNSDNSVNSCKKNNSEKEKFSNSLILDKREASEVVAIVESEKTAVIMSEHCPDAIWLATGGINQFHPQLLLPLRGRRIILFPDTDPDGKTYQQWRQVAKDAQQLLGHPVYVSDLLERNATPEEKARKIDIVDYLAER